LTVLQSLSRSILAALAARGGRQAAPLMGFASLQHIPAARIHCSRAMPLACYGPPSGFGYPLDGFLPLPPRRACFVPTALVGFIPSKRSPLARWLMRFRNRRTRMPLARRDLPLACQRTGAPNTDFQALAPARVPGCPRGISPRLAGGSLGISPFQGNSTSRLVRAYARNSPHALSPRSR
jgi:hypothetical protein